MMGLTEVAWGVTAFVALAFVGGVQQSLERRRIANSLARKAARQARRAARAANREQREAARIAAENAKFAARFAAIDARRQGARAKAPDAGHAETANAILREQLERADEQSASLKQAVADKERSLAASLHAHAASLAEIGRLNSEVGRMAALLEEQAARFQAMQAQSASTSRDDIHFRRLRALIVRELHPDHAAPDSVDRALRSEVFKVIWPKIEAITAEA